MGSIPSERLGLTQLERWQGRPLHWRSCKTSSNLSRELRSNISKGDICSGQVAALVLLGANAVIIGRNKDKTEAKARELAALRPGSKVIGLSADVRSVDSLNAAVAESLKALGRIDFVICGAAGNFLSTVDNLSANAFKTVVDIDLLGSYNTVKATLPALKETKGRIVFVSATMHYTGMPFQSHAAAAKAAVDALSDSLSIEVGPWGITSNVRTSHGILRTSLLTL